MNNKKSFPWGIIIAIMVILIAGAVGAVLFFMREKEEETKLELKNSPEISVKQQTESEEETEQEPETESESESESEKITSIPEFDVDKGDDYSAYYNLIEQARYVTEQKKDYLDYEGELPFSEVFFRQCDISYDTRGYLIADLNGDGVDELFIGENGVDPTGYEDRILDMFTLKDGKAVRIFTTTMHDYGIDSGSGEVGNFYQLTCEGVLVNKWFSWDNGESGITCYQFDGEKLVQTEEYGRDEEDKLEEKYRMYHPRFVSFSAQETETGENVIRARQEGEYVEYPGVTVTGDGYTLLLTEGDFVETAEDTWEVEGNPEIKVWVEKVSDLSIVKGAGREYYLPSNSYLQEEGSSYLQAKIRKGKAGYFVMFYSCPNNVEYLEGWGAVLDGIASTFQAD